MRILIHSNAPWAPTGYGQQCKHLARQLKALGHDIAVSCLYGLSGAPITWDGMTMYPAGRADFSPDVLPGHAAAHQADVVILLMDARALNPVAPLLKSQPWRLIAWMPVDTTDKLSAEDKQFLANSGAMPVGMTEHGTTLIKDAGFWGAVCIPHTIDLTVFRPPADRDALRAEAGVEGRFVIGMNAANMDLHRKAFQEQLDAFARFHAHYDDTVLMLHAAMRTPNGLNLWDMIEDFGIADAVMMTDQYAHTAGLMSPPAMANWYGALDLLTHCSMGEGFGLAALEAQACGVPIVTTDAAAMRELWGSGWAVDGQPFWNHVHRAHWTRVDIIDVEKAYEQAHELERDDWEAMSKDAVEFAARYDASTAGEKYWQPLLTMLTDKDAALDHFAQAVQDRPLPGIYEDDDEREIIAPGDQDHDWPGK